MNAVPSAPAPNLPHAGPALSATVPIPTLPAATSTPATALMQQRTPKERLRGWFRREGEILSPHALRSLSRQMRACLDSKLSDIEAGRIAQDLAQRYEALPLNGRRDFLWLLAEQYAPDPNAVLNARQLYEKSIGSSDQWEAESRLRDALQSDRARLLKRFNAFESGMRFLLGLRVDLMQLVKQEKRFVPLISELDNLFAAWFDVGFLELQRISWDSPASLLEKLIKYEAVHDIRSWSDLRNRLDADRRCYAFFHPRMPSEPLIFVEVALSDAIANNISVLLDEQAPLSDTSRASVAVFYSISNTQPGLKGVSFGNSLLRRVTAALQAELPRLKTFITLPPLPGFRAWVNKHLETALPKIFDPKQQAKLCAELGLESTTRALAQALPNIAEQAAHAGLKTHPGALAMLRLAAHYLAQERMQQQPIDPVARFHLANGARIERLNFAADLSSKGLQQSFGIMVNYSYDLKKVDKHRSLLARGECAVSGEVKNLL
jgi:malonyl-CoA decarboxylase